MNVQILGLVFQGSIIHLKQNNTTKIILLNKQLDQRDQFLSAFFKKRGSETRHIQSRLFSAVFNFTSFCRCTSNVSSFAAYNIVFPVNDVAKIVKRKSQTAFHFILLGLTAGHTKQCKVLPTRKFLNEFQKFK